MDREDRNYILLMILWVLFSILLGCYVGRIINETATLKEESDRREMCLQEVLKHELYSDDNYWGYEITEVICAYDGETEYIIKIYREIHDDSEYWGAIDYWIGGIGNDYIDMDYFKTEYLSENDYEP